MRLHRREEDHYYARRPKSKPRLALIRTHLRGHPFEFMTSSSVFSKKRVDSGTRLLIEAMTLPQRGDLLDLGCGYGPVGIAAATFNPNLHVTMIDVNERAAWLARENVKRNQIHNVEVRRGFLYEPVKNANFSSIVCNPPISAGMQVVKTIIKKAPEHLEQNGSFQIVVKSKIEGKRLQDELKTVFGNVNILDRKGGYRVLYSKKAKNRVSAISD